MDVQNTSEYARPRRPSPESVSYLSGLPLDEHVAAQQAREYVAYFQKKKSSGEEEQKEDEHELSGQPEYPSMLSATHAALSSIFHEFASLACEEAPSQQIETLVRISCRFSLIAKRIILAGISSYWTFLSTHRFGSHVAQTVLRCVVADCEFDLDNFDDGQSQSEAKLVTDGSYGNLLQKDDCSGGIVPHSLYKLLLQSVDELKQFAPELAVHVCGSHVLRTSLCVLSGVEFVDAFAPTGSNGDQNSALGDWDSGALAATRRGKLKDKKKKKKRGGNATADDESGKSLQEHTVMKSIKLVPELESDDYTKDAEKLMSTMVMIISLSDRVGEGVQPPGTLQEHTCHPSAGPLLIQILRLLTFRDFHSKRQHKSNNDFIPDRRLAILPLEPQYSTGSQAESFVHRLLCWDDSIVRNSNDTDGGESTTKQLLAADIIYGLSGEPRGSILLETVFRCCPDSFHDELCQVGGFYEESTLREYIQHGVSNFVVQTLLTSVRNKLQASRMVKCLCGIVEDGSILTARPVQPKDDNDSAKGKLNQLNRPRMGVIWRAFEMCATKGSSQDQEQILFALMRGYASITVNTLQASDENKDDEKKRKKRSRTKGLSPDACIPLLLGLYPGTFDVQGDNSRLTIDAAGARTLYHIFHLKERLRKDWVAGILHIYEREDFVKIANDGLGSRW